MARPKTGKTAKKILDESQIKALAGMGCTMAEMASFFECHQDTLRDNYSSALEAGREAGKVSARRIIWNHFKTGNNIAIKYVIHNILKEKIEDHVEKANPAADDFMAKLSSVSTDAILRLVKSYEVG